MIDIVDRLKFDAVRCEATFSKGVAGNITAAVDEIQRLRKGIQDFLDGNHDNPRQHRPHPCRHGALWYQGCEQCDDEYFTALLATPQSAGAGQG